MSGNRLTGTQFRNEFIKSLNILAPRIAAAVSRFGGNLETEGNLSVLGTADFSGNLTVVGTTALGESDIVSTNTTTDVFDITADSVTTANVIDISADALTSGTILNIVSNSADGNSSRNLVKIHNDNAGANQVALLSLTNDAPNTTSDLLIDTAATTGIVIDVNADSLTTGNVFDVTANALTTGTILNLVSNSATTGTRKLVEIKNDNSSASNTIPLRITQDANDTTVRLRSRNTSSSGDGVRIDFDRDEQLSDDETIARLRFRAENSAGDREDFADMFAIASDVTDGDEGGLIKFRVSAGGLLGTAALKELLNIGGEDQNGNTRASVVINEDGIDCDFRVESDTNTNMFTIRGDRNAVAVAADASLHMDGFSVVDDFHATTFENTFADGEYGSSQILRYSPNANDTLASGQLFFLHSDGTWDQTDASAVATGATQMLGIGLGGSSQTVGCLIRGFIRIPSGEILNLPGSGASDGLPLYISPTAGHLDFTRPSGGGEYVRIVGYALDDHGSDVLIYFNPSPNHVEL